MDDTPFSDLKYSSLLGIGTDICDISRIEALYLRYKEAFLYKTYHISEIAHFKTLPEIKKIPFLAKRFAAKEAFVKALGTGFGKSAFMKDISTLWHPVTHIPLLSVSGHAQETLLALAYPYKPSIALSLADEKNYALAFCILYVENEPITR